MARKITQLPLSSLIADADKFMIAQDASGASKQVSATALKTYLSVAPTESNNIIYVAPNGDDVTGGGLQDTPYKTINHALSTIVDPAIDNRFIIQLAPGIYTETPITLPDFVGINGISSVAVTIQPTDVNSPLISLGNFSALSNFTVEGVTNSIGIQNNIAGISSAISVSVANCKTGIEVSNASAETLIESIAILTVDPTGTSIKVTAGVVTVRGIIFPTSTNVLNCFDISGADSTIKIYNVTTNGGSIGKMLKISSGARAYLMSSAIQGGVASPIGRFIDATGVGTTVHVNGIELSYCDIGVLADDGASLDLISVDTRSCGTAIEIGATGSDTTIILVAMSFIDSINLDMNLLSSTAKIIGTANILADDKLNIVAGAILNISHYSTTGGDEGFSIKGELHVGSPDFPSETCLGEGDSYTRGILVYTFDGTNYVDVTVDAKSNSGSTFTFPNTDVGSAIYISSDLVANGTMDYHKFLGIKNSMAVAQVGGTIIAEYWNGSSWTEVKTMTCQSSGKYYRQADKLFTSIAGSYQVLVNPNVCDDWAKNDDPSVDANDRYWIRFRIDSALSTLPVFEQFKLHSSRTEYNADGYQEYFGLARPYVSMPVAWNTFQDAGSNMGNQDLWLSSNTPVGFTNNTFDSVGDSVGAITSLPSWVDTSAPLKVRVALASETTASATFVATLNSSADGDIISQSDPSSTVGEIQDTKALSLVANEQQWVEFELDISNLGVQGDGQFPDSLWINIEKSVGAVIVNGMQFELMMLKFRDGGHI